MLREQKFIHSRLEELGTMCGAFAHDYNNILGSQIGFCELAIEMLSPDNDAYELVCEAKKAAERGQVSIAELLNVIRGNANAATPAMVFLFIIQYSNSFYCSIPISWFTAKTWTRN